MMRNWRFQKTLIPLIMLHCGLASAAERQPIRPLNVLFIVVDDLRPLLLSYGAPGMKSPIIDNLAHNGATFLRAYCQQALCNPSRSSVMTGVRPDSIDVYSLETHFRKARPDIVTLPQYFKQHGYVTRGLGKVFHSGLDDPQSWTVPHWFATRPTYGDVALDERYAGSDPANKLGPSWLAPTVSDDAFADGATAEKATEVLGELARDKKPFFLAVGFSRPHLPLVAPRRYFDLYPMAQVKVPNNRFPPRGAADIALTDSEELRQYADVPGKGPIPDELARNLVRAYMASTSYVDAQIGRVLVGLERAGLADSTVIIVWGDHGFHLGEHGIWCKGTNFEVAARSPLILVAPRAVPKGLRLSSLVEFVDIYPTVAELAGLPPPAGLEGVSLVPLLADPTRPWKSAAFTQHPRGDLMGRSMRTDRFRYTEWAPAGGQPVERELYDHELDDGENDNLANQARYRALVRDLSARLHAGWPAALPPRVGTN
jgi:arylsulfatase A-like enzyme